MSEEKKDEQTEKSSIFRHLSGESSCGACDGCKEQPNEKRIKAIEELRKAMGTLPEQNSSYETEFHRGVEGLEVHLIGGYSSNPYKEMYMFATETWGRKTKNPLQRWEDTSPEMRFLVVKSVLERDALPLALEIVNFTFLVRGISRWSFDQIARARLGVTFSGFGTRDTNRGDTPFKIHEAIWRNEDWKVKFKRICKQAKELYKEICESGQGNWQIARAILPISAEYGFSMHINYSALLNMCSRRMCFSEAEDTVAFAWLLQKAVSKRFPLLANYLRPACDFRGECLYRKTYSNSELFGCLFQPCGRQNSPPGDYDYATFNESCSSVVTIEEQLKIRIPRPNEWKKYEGIKDLSGRDQELFGYDPHREFLGLPQEKEEG